MKSKRKSKKRNRAPATVLVQVYDPRSGTVSFRRVPVARLLKGKVVTK